MTAVLPLFSSAIMVAFVAIVFSRWFARRRAPLLLWGIGLSMFAVASISEVYLAFRWYPVVFRAWYLFGAMLTAAWIGQGTVYLLARPRVAQGTFVVLAVLSLIGLYGMLTVALDATAFTPEKSLSAQYREVLPKVQEGGWMRLLTIPFNIYGTVALIGGALYSAWLFWRKKSLLFRMWGNILIAVGALVIANASLLTRLGAEDFLYLGELIAAVLMFAGFLVATRRAEEPARGAPSNLPRRQPG